VLTLNDLESIAEASRVSDEKYLRMRSMQAVTAPVRHVTKQTQPRATPAGQQTHHTTSHDVIDQIL